MIIALKKILRKNQYGEYCIKEYRNFNYVKDSDYFTDDLQDLHNTFDCICNDYAKFYNLSLCNHSTSKCSETIILISKGGAK